MKFGEHQPSNFQSARFILTWLLLAICLALNLYQIASLGMNRILPVWAINSVPVAISNLEFNHPSDYTALARVNEAFFSYLGAQGYSDAGLKFHSTDGVDAAIKFARSMSNTEDGQSVYVSSDDKGIMDLVKLAFYLFEYSSEHITYLYWFILSISSILFALRYAHQPGIMLTIYAVLMAHYAVLPVISVNPQIMSVLGIRFLSVLGVVATLHLMFDILTARYLSAIRVLLAGGQVLILVLACHLRVNAYWEVGAVFLSLIVLILIFRISPSNKGIAHEFRNRLLPACMTICMFLASISALVHYRDSVIGQVYKENGGTTHVFWHTLVSGLSLNPTFAQKFQIQIDDVSIFVATEKFLRDHGREEEANELHKKIQYDIYDLQARDMFFQTIKDHPFEFIKTMVFYKPLYAAQFVLWYSRIRSHPPGMDAMGDIAKLELSAMSKRMDLEKRGLYLFNPIAALVWSLGTLMAWGSLKKHGGSILATVTLFSIASLMPVLVGYPGYQSMSDSLVGLFTLGSVASSVLAVHLFNLARNKLAGRPINS